MIASVLALVIPCKKCSRPSPNQALASISASKIRCTGAGCCAAGLLNDFENQLIRQVQQRPEKGRGAGVLFDVLIALQVKLAVDQCVEHVPVSSMMADDKCQQGAAQEAHQPACQLRFAVSVLQAREQI